MRELRRRQGRWEVEGRVREGTQDEYEEVKYRW